MTYSTLDLTLISAQDLKDVNHFSKMEVYVVASIAGDNRLQQRIPADRHNGKNPAWNSTLRFSLPSTGDLSHHVLHILLRSERALGDRDVGEIRIPLSELLNGLATGKGPSTFVSYQVHKTSGKAMGVLNLSYKFIDSAPTKTAAYPPSATAYPPPADKYEEPATAYPAYQQTSKPEPVTAYPAGPSNTTAYPYNPQGYPAASAEVVYGYPPPPQADMGMRRRRRGMVAYGYPPPSQASMGMRRRRRRRGMVAYGYPPPSQASMGMRRRRRGIVTRLRRSSRRRTSLVRWGWGFARMGLRAMRRL